MGVKQAHSAQKVIDERVRELVRDFACQPTNLNLIWYVHGKIGDLAPSLQNQVGPAMIALEPKRKGLWRRIAEAVA